VEVGTKTAFSIIRLILKTESTKSSGDIVGHTGILVQLVGVELMHPGAGQCGRRTAVTLSRQVWWELP
jgi:hypothetical protein